MRNYRIIRSATGLFALFLAAFAGCAQHTTQKAMSGGSENKVDCLVPGQIRQLDERTTIPTQRQVIRVTREECLSRGGEVQSPP